MCILIWWCVCLRKGKVRKVSLVGLRFGVWLRLFGLSLDGWVWFLFCCLFFLVLLCWFFFLWVVFWIFLLRKMLMRLGYLGLFWYSFFVDLLLCLLLVWLLILGGLFCLELLVSVLWLGWGCSFIGGCMFRMLSFLMLIGLVIWFWGLIWIWLLLVRVLCRMFWMVFDFWLVVLLGLLLWFG